MTWAWLSWSGGLLHQLLISFHGLWQYGLRCRVPTRKQRDPAFAASLLRFGTLGRVLPSSCPPDKTGHGSWLVIRVISEPNPRRQIKIRNTHSDRYTGIMYFFT